MRVTIGIAVGILAVMMLIYIYMMPLPYDTDGFVDVGRCGPGTLPGRGPNAGNGVCTDGLRCLNGYCKTDVARLLPPVSDLPIRPDRYDYPVPNPNPLGNVTGTMACDTP